MMRIAEVLYAIPYLLVVILVMIAMKRGIWPLIIAMTITGWIPMARLVRGQVLQLKELEFVHASTAMGAKMGWILKGAYDSEYTWADSCKPDTYGTYRLFLRKQL